GRPAGGTGRVWTAVGPGGFLLGAVCRLRHAFGPRRGGVRGGRPGHRSRARTVLDGPRGPPYPAAAAAFSRFFRLPPAPASPFSPLEAFSFFSPLPPPSAGV